MAGLRERVARATYSNFGDRVKLESARAQRGGAEAQSKYAMNYLMTDGYSESGPVTGKCSHLEALPVPA